ncbi:hypothetical protein SD72_09115 [Leucobacter komagatae]|uniref:Htaa domain-containing protein n=1 Tax=Leucobacter komagatae TaxID=55969 RepID=A0A0D0H5Z6_9MICO|nr:hypothetical protein SD72_09115 [Leucobacter komagatae]
MRYKETFVNRSIVRRGATAVVAAGLAAGVLFGPVSPSFASTEAGNGDVTACTVTSAELRWGVLERFRNYISGSIANGEWTTENGASYETPAFSWPNGTGEFGADLESGSVSFTGDVHFTGHGGLMKLDLQNPEIVFTDPESAQLVVGVASTDVEGGELVFERVTMGKVSLAGADTSNGFSVVDAPVLLTSDGAKALNGDYGDYVAGSNLDPLSLSVETTGCEIGVSTGTAPVPDAPETGTPEAEPAAPEASPEIPWIPIVIGGVALIAIGVTGGMLIAGRGKKSAVVDTPEEPSGE